MERHSIDRCRAAECTTFAEVCFMLLFALCAASHPLPCFASLLCCSSSARLGHNKMLHLNNRVYSCYWDVTLLCLSRASVEQLTAQIAAGPDRSHLPNLIFRRRGQLLMLNVPARFPSSAIKTAVSFTSHLLFSIDLRYSFLRVRAHLVQLRSTPPNALRASHAHSSRANPHDALRHS